MKIKRPLAPGFLNRTDAWLLLHKPDIWSTRVHLVLYYSLLAALAIAGVSYMSPLHYQEHSTVFFWTWMTGLVSLIGLVVWIIYLLRFNIFKRYGKLSAGYSVKNFICYFISIACFVLLPFLPSYMETFRTKMKYSMAELIQDVNTINTSIAQIEYNAIDHTWKIDTFYVHKNKPHVNYRKKTGLDNQQAPKEMVARDQVIVADTSFSQNQVIVIEDSNALETAAIHSRYVTRGYAHVDESYLADLKLNNDSIHQLNDSLYVAYTPPSYQYISSYRLQKTNHLSILSNREIYDKVIRKYEKNDLTETKNALKDLLKKYYNDPGYSAYKKPNYPFADADEHADLLYKYQLSSVEHSITNIAEKLSRFHTKELPILFRVFIYITLGLTLLVYIFRHSEKRTFFLSILVAVLLFILTSLFLAFNSAPEAFIVGLMIFYMLIFFLISLSIWASKVRSAIAGIGLNLFTYCVFGLPLLIVGLSHLLEKERYRSAMNTSTEVYDYNETYNYPDYSNAYLYAEWAGFALLLLLIATYIHKTYRKWYALPEN